MYYIFHLFPPLNYKTLLSQTMNNVKLFIVYKLNKNIILFPLKFILPRSFGRISGNFHIVGSFF